MWRDRIIAAKKEKGITTKMMSDMVRIPENTITRILSGRTQTPRIDTVLDLGAAVGLTATELFAEAVSFLGDKDIAILREELTAAQATINALTENVKTLAEQNAQLTVDLAAAKTDADTLRLNLAAAKKIIQLQDEIIEMHHKPQN